MNFLDLIFPKRCVNCGKVGSYICNNCYSKIEFIEKPVCPVCQRQALGGKTHPGCAGRFRLDGLVVSTRYKGVVSAAIVQLKYRWVYDIAKILNELLVKNIWKFDIPQNLIMVPVPLHKSRKNWRGFNQAETLTKLLSKNFKVNIADILIRKTETKSQVGLKRDDRKRNVRDVFCLNGEFEQKVSGRSFILFDDVYTSGATMFECAKILKKAGAKSVWGMAVALG